MQPAQTLFKSPSLWEATLKVTSAIRKDYEMLSIISIITAVFIIYEFVRSSVQGMLDLSAELVVAITCAVLLKLGFEGGGC